ncbi:MarR family transcriptional regulator [Saccharopolyspora rhizosphaerae]|uniref:MarR family transcriptional regulator n=1 Tax=Saccharopolyspora rhizosphaerae TaxID=2492662 RepID=A0A3R8QKW9_9PSEU|nr:MarR family winged helix-turn-helix transcriptional regulator [Saccharopolyspora rhizosphaerae]RRO14744.1 MarR family transcriptional regulator [Saccharopolyspora rhizosphaerae]
MSAEGQTLLRLLVQSATAFERRLNDGLRAELGDELRPAHYAVFRYLDPAGSRVSELAEAAGMTQQAMGELVTHLERCGYVERRPDPADGRARQVVATPAGRAALRVAADRIRAIEQALGDHLGADELCQLRKLLVRLDEGLRES